MERRGNILEECLISNVEFLSFSDLRPRWLSWLIWLGVRSMIKYKVKSRKLKVFSVLDFQLVIPQLRDYDFNKLKSLDLRIKN
jgi:hypothetical protein